MSTSLSSSDFPQVTWCCGRYTLRLDQPAIMAIINVTPDSFSGDGLAGSVDRALRQAEQALAEGACILDVGGESTRPGAAQVSVADELARVIPVVRALSVLGVPISVDTMKTEVMAESLAAGASIINDINALQSPGALDVVAATDAGVCLMHMQGEPRTMQQAPAYGDVASDVKRFLLRQADAAMARGVARERISLDPGFGFGKSLEHNLALFRSMDTWVAEGFPLLVGVSRKTMIGAMTGRPVGERVTGSAVAAVLAAQRGAQILRVHDVAATRDALSIWAAIDLGRTNAY